jgi:hypothetical protein
VKKEEQPKVEDEGRAWRERKLKELLRVGQIKEKEFQCSLNKLRN